MDIFDLAGEVAIVVGGTGVLGGHIASGLARAGAEVAVQGRREVEGRQRVEAITADGGSAAYVFCDAAERESVESAHGESHDLFGNPSILVNAAGENSPRVTVTEALPFDAIDPEDWQENFKMNVVAGALVPCKVIGGSMVRSGGGSIVNIASVAAHVPPSRVPAYSAAKSAVLSLTQFLAREWAEQGVRVMSITPGFFPAEQNRRLLYEEDGTPTARARQILEHTPMSRFGAPDELIGAAIFLVSSRASAFVTGADIRVDGGFLATTI